MIVDFVALCEEHSREIIFDELRLWLDLDLG
jgi:hypothetical protein